MTCFTNHLVTGWITTKMERDKSILTLAGGGIGLAVTLMIAVGPTSCNMLWLYGLSVLFFVISLVTIVIVLDKNADHFEAVAKGKTEKDPNLGLMDKVSFWSFVLGSVFLTIVAIMTGTNKLNQKDEAPIMNDKSSAVKPSPELLKKSINGVGVLKPQPTTTAAQQSQQQQQSSNKVGPKEK